ncbi:hypothetical protein [Sphingomonas sp. SRS2]|uniref:hypothetical protein n=1 Tax=Sphingomonas sp. SRS2 TaxID=133190 RepID=UPI0006184932|nr:hypothetical protein [Sphingomonas sp. SRS2]KKC24929.1 hypothetical protein WP12_17070 [Sphingomonas sp. SRS2]
MIGGKWLGVRSTRRFLANIEPEARRELNDEFQAIGDRLLGNALAETPRRYGGLVSAIQKRVTIGASLILRLGLLTRRAKSEFFYGYILDQGRRAGRANAARVRKDGTVERYLVNVGAIGRSKYNFVFGRRADFDANELPRLRSIFDRILRRASAGVGND